MLFALMLGLSVYYSCMSRSTTELDNISVLDIIIVRFIFSAVPYYIFM